MTTIATFDNWYKTLSKEEQSKLLTHVIETKIEVSMEGFFSGPSGTQITKGLYAGPSGQLLTSKCPQCGR